MKIVTLMNYDDPAGVRMCKGWLYLARRFNPYAPIIVLHADKYSEIETFAKERIGNVLFERLDTDKVMPREKMRGWTFYCQDLTFARWVTLERLALTYYIFVEADAWMLSDLTDWWKVSQEKPFIAVREEGRPGDPYFNIGCFSHFGPPFFTYAKLMEEYRLAGDQIPISIGDQALMNLWAWRNKYDAFHPLIDKMWNCPTYDRMYGIKLGRCDDDAIEAWDHGKRIRIMHTWGPRKWWETPELAPICKYVEEKIRG